MSEKTANRILFFGALAFTGLAIFAVYLGPNVIAFWRWKLPVVFVTCALFLFAAQRLPFLIKVNLLVLCALLGIGLYTTELLLPVSLGEEEFALMRKFQSAGQSNEMFLSMADHELAVPLLPLAGRANILTLLCRESKDWALYHSDEYGFNNPPLLQRRPVDIALVGDSFTHGYCVPEGADIASVIRSRYPRTVNLGVGGAGALLRLANLREYANPLQPKLVIWIETENTMHRLYREKRLEQYLQPNFSQNLRAHQEELDKALSGRILEIRARHEKPYLRQRLFLVNVRALIRKIVMQQKGASRHSPEFEARYREVLQVAAREVKGWNGQFVIAFLNLYEKKASSSKPFVSSVAKELNIPFVDLQGVFPEPLDLQGIFPAGNNALHYSVSGYRAVGEYLVRWVDHNIPAGRLEQAKKRP